MTDTLRSIADGMEHEPNIMDYHVPRSCLPTCPKCRLEALRAEYGKVDLVKRWHESGRGLTSEVQQKCAAQLETWLAVNLERIKVEARLEGEISEHKRTCQMYWHVCRGNDARCSEGYTCERLAALEAQAKEKP